MTNSTLQGDMRETFRSFHEDDHKARHPPPKTNEFCPAQRLPFPPRPPWHCRRQYRSRHRPHR